MFDEENESSIEQLRGMSIWGFIALMVAAILVMIIALFFTH